MSDALTPPKAVLFDWDGTLVDSFALILAAHNHARKTLGMPLFQDAEFRPYFGQPREVLYRDIYGDMGEQARAYFEDFVSLNHADFITPITGAEALLKALKSREIPIAIVTNKKRTFVELEIKHLGWESYFSSIVASSEAEQDKPSPAPLFLALERAELSLDMADVWYIGDTQIDMDAAQAAGCVSVFVGDTGAIYDSNTENQPPLVVENCAALEQFLLQCWQK